MELISLHNHTLFCDGKSSMEDFVKTAAADGAGAIGFSGHSRMPFYEEYCMTEESEAAYNKEIDRLRGVYGDRIKIYRGIEADLFGTSPLDGYDYVIGSAHYILKDGVYLEIDESKETAIRNVKEYYGGDHYAYVRDYYRMVVMSAKRKETDIVGHLDLVTKFNEGKALFDDESLKYLEPAFEAVEELLPYDKVFEMNTGAMSRGYRTEPYIALPVLKFMKAHNVRMTVSADAHAADCYRYRFDLAIEMLKAAGYREVWEFDGKGFVPCPIG